MVELERLRRFDVRLGGICRVFMGLWGVLFLSGASVQADEVRLNMTVNIEPLQAPLTPRQYVVYCKVYSSSDQTESNLIGTSSIRPIGFAGFEGLSRPQSRTVSVDFGLAVPESYYCYINVGRDIRGHQAAVIRDGEVLSEYVNEANTVHELRGRFIKNEAGVITGVEPLN